jgi:hypothetical protein
MPIDHDAPLSGGRDSLTNRLSALQYVSEYDMNSLRGRVRRRPTRTTSIPDRRYGRRDLPSPRASHGRPGETPGPTVQSG